MADTYTDPADDSLVSPWDLPLPNGRKAPQGAVTGIRSTAPVTGAWGNEGYFGDINNTGESPGLLSTLKKTARQTKYQFFSPPSDTTGEDTSTIPVQQKNLLPPAATGPFAQKAVRPNDVSEVREQPMGSNDLPPLQEKPPTPPPSGQTPSNSRPVKTTAEGPVGGRILAGTGDVNVSRADPPPAQEPLDINPTQFPQPHKEQPGGSNAGFPQDRDPTQDGGLGRLFSSFNNWRDQNRMTLMALAGGLMQSRGKNDWSGAGRGFSQAATMMPQQNALNNQNATMQWLMTPQGGSMDPNMARAVSANPALVQDALGQASGIAPPKTLTWKDALGSEHVAQFIPGKGWLPLQVGGVANPYPVGANGSPTGNYSGGPGQGGNTQTALPTSMSDEQWAAASPDDRIASITDPQLRNLMQAMHTGGNVPGGRQQQAAIEAMIQSVEPGWSMATKVDAEKKMATGLASANLSSYGGAMLRGMSTFGHYADAAEASANVGGWSGWNGPGGTLAGNAYMAGRDLQKDPRLSSLRSTEQNQWKTATTEATSFYSQSPGSEGERTSGLKAVDPSATPLEKAGVLRGAAQQLQTKIDYLQDQVNGTAAGRQYFRDHPDLIPRMKRDQARLNNALIKLDPTGPEAQAAQAAQQPPQAQVAPQRQPVRTATNPQTGQRIADYGDGKWVPLQ